MISAQCIQDLHGFCRAGSECDCPHHDQSCAQCGRTNLLKTYTTDDGELCAQCYRVICMARNNAHVEKCEHPGCDKPGFRNPQTRRNEFFCLTHHVESGEYLAIAGSGGRELIADCLGADEHDERHRWVHVKSARYACSKCSAKKWDTKARDQQFRR